MPIRSRNIIAALILCWAVALATISSFAQDDQSQGNRKVVSRVMPNYPPVARTMNIRGNVKVEAVVSANGTVKSLEIKGGHPMLVNAAADAVRKWKWAPAAHESKEPVTIKFDPSD
jgi:TonB family protein